MSIKLLILVRYVDPPERAFSNMYRAHMNVKSPDTPRLICVSDI
jgi:hypothetical protein